MWNDNKEIKNDNDLIKIEGELIKKIRYSINTYKGEIVYLSSKVPEITVKEIEKSNIKKGLDLVEVSKSANPPVFKIMDSGKMKYEENKKAKANVKRGPKQKDIIFKIGIQDNDFKIKVNKITEFLEKGHRVNVSVSLKGRQQYHSDIGVELVQRAIQAAAATYELHDAVISTQGKLISTVLTRK